MTPTATRCSIPSGSMLAPTAEAERVQPELDDLHHVLESRRDIDFQQESDFIRRSLEGELASSLFGRNGRIEASFDDDPMIHKAVEVFGNKPEYAKLFASAPTPKGE